MKDRAHYIQWPPTASLGEAPTRPEAQLCGFLWRKRWLGQWAKQLFIIREHTLLVSIRQGQVEAGLPWGQAHALRTQQVPGE